MMSRCLLISFFTSLLVACGGGGGDAPAPVINTAPIFNDPGLLSVLEGSSSVASLSASDAEGNQLIFSIEAVNEQSDVDDRSLFSISSAGALSFKTPPDFEVPADKDKDNVYLLSAQVTDGSLTDNQSITVTLKDAFEGRVVDAPISGASVFVDLNGDNIKGSGEPTSTTNSNGYFYVDSFTPSSDGTSQIVSRGGRDITTGKRLPNLVLLSDIPSDLKKLASITPLTTVLSSISSAESKAQMLINLGISVSVENLLSSDGWAKAKAADVSAKKQQRINQQVGLILQSATTLTDDDDSSTDVSISLAKSVAKQISSLAQSQGSIDLTASATIQTVLTKVVQEVMPAIAISTSKLAAISNTLATINALVSSTTLDPVSFTAKQIITSTQNSMQTSIANLVSDEIVVSDFANETGVSILLANVAVASDAPDNDGDGIADLLDVDDDNDNVRDSIDAFSFDATETLDTDGDSIGNNADTDDDGDGVADTSDAFPLITLNGRTDTDSDGRPDSCDSSCQGKGMIADTDDDGDGVADTSDAFPLDSTETLDTDSDSIGNNADTDDDGDGVADTSDAYPLNVNVHTAPTSATASYYINLLPRVTNGDSDTLTSTSQDSRSVTYSIVENATSGTATITNTSTGAFTYSTTQTTAAADYFTYKVNDGYVDSATAKININLKTDPLYKHQWHLDNTGQKNFATNAGTSGADLNVDGAIAAGKTGAGIIVAIVDSGLEITHEDIVDNVVTNGSWSFTDSSNNPAPTGSGADHGTMVAGIVAAKGWNNLGGRGVAPNASIKAFNFLSGSNNSSANHVKSLGASSFSLAADVSIFNMSYGGPATALSQPSSALQDQLAAGVNDLRNSKGALYVTSSGNDYYKGATGTSLFSYCGDGDNAGTYKIGCYDAVFDPIYLMVEIIGVGSLSADGVKASYSTPGASLWVSAPGGEYGLDLDLDVNMEDTSLPYPRKPAIMTLDRSSCSLGSVSSSDASVNAFNTNESPHAENLSCNYTSSMNGTSAAAPMVSGVIALMLEANPALTWRDVKHILATTAVQVDSGFSAANFESISYVSWVTNSTGLKFHPWYGFGAVDATAAVNAAIAYTTGSLGSVSQTSWNLTAIQSVSMDDLSLYTQSITESGSGTIEHLKVAMKISHSDPNHLGFRLESPSGTISTLLPPLTALATDLSSSQWVYLPSNAFYGETKVGDWKLHIIDHISGSTGTFVQAGIQFDNR
jgi:subtilisin family serine protease